MYFEGSTTIFQVEEYIISKHLVLVPFLGLAYSLIKLILGCLQQKVEDSFPHLI
jgi:hypothetical protein